jgi:hypothetical protein
VLVSFLLCAFKGSLQILLDDLFTTLDDHSVRAVSKSAVSQARQKLKATAFEVLNDSLISLLNERLPEPRWQGLRLVATDSTTLRLPPWLENQAEFGVQTDSGGQPYVLARALGLFATTSKLIPTGHKCSKPSWGVLRTPSERCWCHCCRILPATTY